MAPFSDMLLYFISLYKHRISASLPLNDKITLALFAQTPNLKEHKISVLIYPDERLDEDVIWKAETCLIYNISLMVDDEYSIVHTN